MAKRLNIEVNDDVAALIRKLAERNNSSNAEVVRRALAIMKVAERQRELGRVHFGFSKDPDKLDAELVGLFD